MNIKINHNTKLIIILIATSIFFVGVLAILYFTYGNNSLNNNTNIDNVESSTSSISKTTKTFEEDTKTAQNSSISTVSEITNSKSEEIKINSSQVSSVNSYSDIINPDLKLPSASKIDYSFDSKDKEIIGKYIKTDYQNKIISILKDGKNSGILTFQIPKENIDPQTQKDFPRTFSFSNEDRKPQSKNSVFLYYTAEKRIAYLGEFISNIQPFSYEDKDYWLVLYNRELLISEPNFTNWKTVNLSNDPIEDIYKKSNFEFQVLKAASYENYDEYRVETISPQKYIIDGIFSPISD